MRARWKLTGIVIVILVWAWWYLKFAGHHLSFQSTNVAPDFWGVTFSKKYAEELGLNWRDAYRAVVNDLGVVNVRLPVYWDDVERERDVFNFRDYDWMLEEGSRLNVRFILNIGRRLPRWPECHQPSWTIALSDDEIKQEQLQAVQTMIRHFKSFRVIESWQLENEYFFPWFGLCPKADLDLIQQEIRLLRAEDERPLVLTDSGELNNWSRAARYSDILGITIYRVVWNDYFGYFRWPWPAWLYRLKASVAGKSQAKTLVAELQAEPWPSQFRGVTDVSQDEAKKSFSLKQFETNSELARRTGFLKAYFWGVEWWYWLKEKGDASMWDKAKHIIQTGHGE